MNPIQESKQELEASIRYAENAIASAKQTIESIAKSQEQTGREEALTKQVQELEERNDGLNAQVADLNVEVQRQQGLGQGYYDSMMTFKEKADSLAATIQRLKDERRLDKVCAPTMPVIPRDVAIAIFREGVAHGVGAACTELDEATYIRIEESEYVGDFHVTFERDIDLSDHVDTDWMRDKVGDYTEEGAIEALKNLCADEKFECRIHGVDDQEEKKND